MTIGIFKLNIDNFLYHFSLILIVHQKSAFPQTSRVSVRKLTSIGKHIRQHIRYLSKATAIQLRKQSAHVYSHCLRIKCVSSVISATSYKYSPEYRSERIRTWHLAIREVEELGGVNPFGERPLQPEERMSVLDRALLKAFARRTPDEAGILEDPNTTPPADMWKLTNSPENAPDKAEKVDITFTKGVPTKVTVASTPGKAGHYQLSTSQTTAL